MGFSRKFKCTKTSADLVGNLSLTVTEYLYWLRRKGVHIRPFGSALLQINLHVVLCTERNRNVIMRLFKNWTTLGGRRIMKIPQIGRKTWLLKKKKKNKRRDKRNRAEIPEQIPGQWRWCRRSPAFYPSNDDGQISWRNWFRSLNCIFPDKLNEHRKHLSLSKILMSVYYWKY